MARGLFIFGYDGRDNNIVLDYCDEKRCLIVKKVNNQGFHNVLSKKKDDL